MLMNNSTHRFAYAALCTIIIAAAAFSPARAAIFCVDPTSGDDSAGGSAAHPWRTIEKAKKNARPGDTVELMPADYGEVTFTPADKCGEESAYITYRSNPAAAPHTARFSHLAFRGAHFHIAIQGCDVENTGSKDACIKIEKASHVKIAACKVHGRPNAAGPTHANIVVKAADNVLIANCEIYHSGPSAHAVQLEGSDTVTVRDCHVHDIVSSGIRTHGGKNYTIEYNVIHDQRADWNPSVHGSGISIRSSRTTLRGNVVYNYGNTRPIRFYPDYAGPDGYAEMHVENNLVYKTPDFPGTQWWTEFLDLGPDCTFRNNTFVGDVVMTLATRSDGAGLSLYNNIITGRLQVEPLPKWPNIRQGNNIMGKLAAKGCGWLCFRSDFTAGRRNKVGATCSVGGFFQSGPAHYPYTGEHPYQLNPRSPAIDFADPNETPSTDLLKQERQGPPDAGCLEHIS